MPLGFLPATGWVSPSLPLAATMILPADSAVTMAACSSGSMVFAAQTFTGVLGALGP